MKAQGSRLCFGDEELDGTGISLGTERPPDAWGAEEQRAGQDRATGLQDKTTGMLLGPSPGRRLGQGFPCWCWITCGMWCPRPAMTAPPPTPGAPSESSSSILVSLCLIGHRSGASEEAGEASCILLSQELGTGDPSEGVRLQECISTTLVPIDQVTGLSIV